METAFHPGSAYRAREAPCRAWQDETSEASG